MTAAPRGRARKPPSAPSGLAPPPSGGGGHGAPAGGADGGADAVQAALRQLLAPLARLAVTRGVPHAVLDELLKLALVQAANAAHDELPPHRRVSRISTITGLHRREASRLQQVLHDGEAADQSPRRSRASQVLAHWLTSADFTERRGAPRVLPRQGPSPSFEALARAVTRDVHPRGMLDELVRLGMVTHDREADTVQLAAGAATPRADHRRMLQFLGDNVGDHLAGAVDNVLADGRRHFEQAVFADGLSARSLSEVREQVSAQWQALLQAFVPQLEALVERDETLPDARHRLRIGLYTFDDAPAGVSSAPPDSPHSTEDPPK